MKKNNLIIWLFWINFYIFTDFSVWIFKNSITCSLPVRGTVR